MPAISADDHHSAVNPHETMQRLFAFALDRRVGVDVVRSAGEGGLAALNFLVPGLLDEPSAPPDRLRVFDAFATLLARLSSAHAAIDWRLRPAIGETPEVVAAMAEAALREAPPGGT